MATMASGSTESMLRTGLDAAVHAHYGWDLRLGLSTLPNLERIIIGTDNIHPLLDTRRVKGNCDIGKIVCERVFERPWDPLQSKREEQWYGNGTQARRYLCLYCTKQIAVVVNGTAQMAFLKHSTNCSMDKCKAFMTSDALAKLETAITSFRDAHTAAKNQTARAMLIGHTAALSRVEDALSDVVSDNRKRKAGEALLGEAEYMNGQAHIREDTVSLREEDSMRERAELDKDKAALERREAELERTRAELNEQAQTGGVGGHDVSYSNAPCMACQLTIGASCKESEWAMTEAITCGDHYICGPCFCEYNVTLADNGNVCMHHACNRPLKIANSQVVSAKLTEIFGKALAANAKQKAERQMTLQNNTRMVDDIVYDRCLQLLDTDLTQFCPTCCTPCLNDETGCDTIYCTLCSYTFCTICGYGITAAEKTRMAAAEGRDVDSLICPVHEHCKTAPDHGDALEGEDHGTATGTYFNILYRNGKKWMRVHAIRRAAVHLGGLDHEAQVSVIRKLYKMSQLVTRDVADSILRTLKKEPRHSYSPSPSPSVSPLVSPLLRPESPEVIVLSDSDTASSDNATADNATANHNTDGPPFPMPGLYRNHRHYKSHIDAHQTLMAMGFIPNRTEAVLRELIEVEADDVLGFATEVLIAESNY